MILIFATHNAKKLIEAQSILPASVVIKSLVDVAYDQEIIENADTFEGNATLKTDAIFSAFGEACFADDSGLVVPSLNGLPGVKSARYASDSMPVDHQANNDKLLRALNNEMDRSAYFISVVCLKLPNQTELYFEGRVTGRIADSPQGDLGFGYDPIFIPDGHTQTFAELGPAVKNQISHRARAFNQMSAFLQSQI
jgi:XTP/dITP diphosphohydrolase